MCVVTALGNDPKVCRRTDAVNVNVPPCSKSMSRRRTALGVPAVRRDGLLSQRYRLAFIMPHAHATTADCYCGLQATKGLAESLRTICVRGFKSTQYVRGKLERPHYYRSREASCVVFVEETALLFQEKTGSTCSGYVHVQLGCAFFNPYRKIRSLLL